MSRDRLGPFTLLQTAAVSVALVCVAIGAWTGWILALNGGHFTYSLDDPYIHLSMAEHILRGGYGVNGGEAASASSSILYPLLMAAGLALGLGQWAPLLVNALADAGSLLLLALIAREAGALPQTLSRTAAILLLAMALLVLNLIGLAFTGLEHCLHLLLTLAAVLGIVRLGRSGRAEWWFLAALILQPLVRFEGAAVTAAGVLVLMLKGRWRAALVVVAADAVLLGGFSAFLLHLGLPPLPSSVLAKAAGAQAQSGLLSRWGVPHLQLVDNLARPIGLVLLGVLAVLAVHLWRDRRAGAWTPERLTALSAACVIAAHLVLAPLGWFHRYEGYLVALSAAALIVVYGASRPPLLRVVLAAIILGMGSLTATVRTPAAATEVYRQQHQMHRIAVEAIGAPVAVNDLGQVAWRNPHYVLDLWGLGSEAARKARASADPAAAINALVRSHGVRLILIYDAWFPRRPAAWRRVGVLWLHGPAYAVAGQVVTLYAPDEGSRAWATARLKAFAPTLPNGASLVLDPMPKI